MEMANPTAHRLRLRLATGVRRPVRVAAGAGAEPARGGGPPVHVVVTLDGVRWVVPADGPAGPVAAGVALLRTVFEDHAVDPGHADCLFFHGRTLGNPGTGFDFSVTHRGDAVLLSDFTGPAPPGPILLPWREYAAEVLRFAREAAARSSPPAGPAWCRAYWEEKARQLEALIGLTQRALAGPADRPARWAGAFYRLHGHLKRPLEMVVTQVLGEGSLPPDVIGPEDAVAAARLPVQAGEPAGSAGARQAARSGEPAPAAETPWVVRCRVVFGPLRAGEVVPLTVNRGDVVVGEVEGFEASGVRLRVMGVGSGGLAPGDVLRGLQLFYP